MFQQMRTASFRDIISLLKVWPFNEIRAGGFKMLMKKIKEIAIDSGVKPGKMKKGELIRAIQRAEGNADCFATARVNDCNQINCLWREDCQSELYAAADVPVVSQCI